MVGSGAELINLDSSIKMGGVTSEDQIYEEREGPKQTLTDSIDQHAPASNEEGSAAAEQIYAEGIHTSEDVVRVVADA